MPLKVNKVFLDPSKTDSGPREFCHICKAYFVWLNGVWRCPACGKQGNVISSNKKTLKADVAQPIIANKGTKDKNKKDPDLPDGAKWLTDDKL